MHSFTIILNNNTNNKTHYPQGEPQCVKKVDCTINNLCPYTVQIIRRHKYEGVIREFVPDNHNATTKHH